MMISTKGRYALRVMTDLAQHGTGDFIPLKEISARQGISLKYLESIMTILSKGHMVRSASGKGGGYCLIKSPEEYRVGDILRLTEGDLAPVACLDEDDYDCDRRDMCVTVMVYKKINDAINDVVDNITLQDLVDWQSEKNGSYII